MQNRNKMFYWQSDRPYTYQQIKEIFLDRKNDYSKDQIKLAAEHAIGESVKELLPPIDYGSVNIVCPFTTVSGKEWVIRVHPHQVQNYYFYSEKLAMSLASTANVPVPTQVIVDDSRSVVPFDYMVMSRIPGLVMQVALEKDPSQEKTYLEQIGKYLGQLHTLRTSNYGFFDNQKAKSGQLVGIHQSNQEHFQAALDLDEQFYKDNIDQVDPKLSEQAIKILRANTSLAQCDQPTLIQNDIAVWNTVVDDDKVTGILDWDECFSGDPVFEFATMSLFYTDEQMETIKQGYQSTNTLPHDYNKKFDLYVLRYIINKSKISINKLRSIEKASTRHRFESAKTKLKILVDKLS